MARVDVCERCGEEAEGRERLMFYSRLERDSSSRVAREFYCFACLRRMRVYAVVGFVLLGGVVAGLVGVTVWLIASSP